MAIKNNIRAFTLLEVMIVVIIVGILASISVPGIMAAIPRFKLRAEARELVINFKKAKLEAVKRNREVFIDFINVAVPNGSYRLFVNVDRDVNSPHTYDPGAGDILLVNRQIQGTLQVMATTFTNNQAGYNARGLPTQLANQNVILGTSDGTRAYTISISQAGNVRIQ